MRSIVIVASAMLTSSVITISDDVAAADRWIDRPLVLPAYQASIDVAAAYGRCDACASASAPSTRAIDAAWASTMETAIGLPILFELGARFAVRYGASGGAAQSDRYAHLFDAVATDRGGGRVANPELYLRGAVFDFDGAQVAIFTSATFASATGSRFALTPAIEARAPLAGIVRLDTGVYFPIAWHQPKDFAVEIPLRAFAQIGPAFIGPITGVRFVKDGAGANPWIMLGAGGGVTLGARVDLKAQIVAEHVNDPDAGHAFGASLGLGLRVP